MIPLLGPISLRRLTEHRLRTAMTVLGIALGVAVVVAVATVNEAVVGSFADTIGRVSGKVDLEVRAASAGVPDTVLDRIRATAGVAHATPVVQRTVTVAAHEGEIVVLLGIDFTADAATLSHFYGLGPDQLPGRGSGDSVAPTADDFEDPFAFLDARRQLVIGRSLADRFGVAQGGVLALLTPQGEQDFTIHAVVDGDGAGSALGGNVAVLDWLDAQEVFRLDHQVDRVDVAVSRPGLDGEIDTVAARIGSALESRWQVERPSSRQSRQNHLLRTFRLAFAIGAGVALIVGMFLIFHTLSISVAQRRNEIGILRAVGATRRQIVALFTFEGALLGVMGSAAGLVLGALLASGMLEQAAEGIEQLYMRVRVDEVHVPAWAFILGACSGIVCATLASVIPALRASRLRPVDTIRSAQVEQSAVSAGRPGRRELAAVACLIAAPLVADGPAVFGDLPIFGLLALLLITLGATLGCRQVILLCHAAGHRLVGRLGGIEARLAVDNLRRNADKAAVTVASLMIGLSMVLSSVIMTSSFERSVDRWIEQVVPADLFVTSGAKFGGISNQPLSPALADEIATVPGVAAVDRVRLKIDDFRHSRIYLVSLETKVRFAGGLAWPFARVDGDADTVIERMRNEEAVVISEALSFHFGLHPGDLLELATPEGVRKFPIAATLIDYTSDQGTVFLDRATWLRFWHDDTVDTFEPYLKPGVDPGPVRDEIVRRWGRRYQLFVYTNREFRDEVRQSVGEVFQITRALELVTLMIAVLSVITTLLTTILDRMREIGMLRAIGMLRSQVARMVIIESVLLAVVGALVGLATGILNGFLTLEVVNARFLGRQVPVVLPWLTIAAYAAGVVVVGGLAAMWPARTASRVPVVTALGYE